MSTWISRATACLCFVLTGCQPGDFGLGPSGGAPEALAVVGGEVVVAGPRGYCVDTGSSRDGPQGPFVLFGTCAALSGRGGSLPGNPAVLTASVQPGPAREGLEERIPQLEGFFRSPSGREAMSRAGDPESVTVVEAVSRGNVLYLHVRDTSTTRGQQVQPDYWRAIMEVRGRVVTLSALGLPDRPLSDSDKRRTLEAFVTRMRAANPAS